MPDWVTHLLIAGGAAKALRLDNLRLVLLGALLPDVPAVAGTLSDLGWLPFDTYRLMVMMLPLSSPFTVGLLCLAVALWMSKPWPALGLLALGAATHVAADFMQVGHVHMLAYPFSLELYSGTVDILDESGHGVVGLIALVLLLAGRRWAGRPNITWAWRRGWLAVLPLALLVGALAWSRPRIEEANALNLRFLRGEEVGQDEPVWLISARVVNAEPLVVRKLRREVRVEWEGPVPAEALVSVWGIYRDGRVVAERLVEHRVGRKIALSVLGLMVLGLYWVPWPPPGRPTGRLT